MNAPLRGRGPRIALVAASVVYLGVLSRLTLGPADANGGGALQRIADTLSQWPPLGWVSFDLLEFTANVALFTPAGALALLWLGRRRAGLALAVLVGLALSGTIEAVQTLLPDRVPDVRDLIANTSGAAIGAALTAAVRAALFPSERVRASRSDGRRRTVRR